MALIDTDVRRTFATGIAGFSHVVDSLSAIRYAKVRVIRDEEGIAMGFETEGDFPRYGNDDDRADDIAVWLLKTFLNKIKKYHTYRNSEPTTSILTITSNVVYGKATGATPDGREAYKPFAPGGNPSYGAEKEGLLASLNSVAKVPYECHGRLFRPRCASPQRQCIRNREADRLHGASREARIREFYHPCFRVILQ